MEQTFIEELNTFDDIANIDDCQVINSIFRKE
jgi:hypothetical protein